MDSAWRYAGSYILAIFIVPVLFVVITRLSYGKKKLEALKEQVPGLTE
jgi:HAE1 family hydrophobic/amphiphilic exporter-1